MKLSLIGTIGSLMFSGLAIEYHWHDYAYATLLAIACVFGFLNCVGYIQHRTFKANEERTWQRLRKYGVVSERTNGPVVNEHERQHSLRRLPSTKGHGP